MDASDGMYRSRQHRSLASAPMQMVEQVSDSPIVRPLVPYGKEAFIAFLGGPSCNFGQPPLL